MLKQRYYQYGTSLVELMISMAMGFASLTAMSSLVGHGIGLNAQLIAKSRLEEEVNAIVGLMVSDIQRAGFNGDMQQILTDPNHHTSPFFDSLQLSNYPSEPANSCLQFAYDRNHNGQLDTHHTNENYGYRLKDGAIEIRLGGLSCSAGGWHDLSDPNIVKVTKLEFSLQQRLIYGGSIKRVNFLLEAEHLSHTALSTRVETSFLIKNNG